MRSRSHPATQMLVSEKERDDLLSTSLVAVTRNTLRAGEVPVRARYTRTVNVVCGLQVPRLRVGRAESVLSPPSRLEMERRPTGGLLHFISSCC